MPASSREAAKSVLEAATLSRQKWAFAQIRICWQPVTSLALLVVRARWIAELKAESLVLEKRLRRQIEQEERR